MSPIADRGWGNRRYSSHGDNGKIMFMESKLSAKKRGGGRVELRVEAAVLLLICGARVANARTELLVTAFVIRAMTLVAFPVNLSMTRVRESMILRTNRSAAPKAQEWDQWLEDSPRLACSQSLG